MRIGVLTAALQELTPREVRANDPDQGSVYSWPSLDFGVAEVARLPET
jgi:hypothetical protein